MPPSVTSATSVAAEDGLDQLGGAPLLVALEVGDDPAADGDVEVAGQPGEPAGVLGGDHVGAGQHLPQPGRGVAGVAERRTEQDQAPSFGHFTHGLVSFIDARTGIRDDGRHRDTWQPTIAG